MKKIYLVTAILFFIQFNVLSQCLPGGINFNSQEDIDNFQANYPGCTEIQGDVTIYSYNSNITDLTGLSVITSIGGFLGIFYNDNLTTLSGLDALTSIGDYLDISENALTNLDGLNGLTSIGGQLIIRTNFSLTSIDGLENVSSIAGDITIEYNGSLSTCSIQSICDFLSNPNGEIYIHDNAPGCNSQNEVADACGLCGPYGVNLTSQADIDNFQYNYSGCNEIVGDVIISGYDITDLSGLNVLTSIGGNLFVYYNASLTDFSGLENLETIGGTFSISGNDVLENFSGLENLTFIGGDLLLGYWYYGGANLSLTNLNGLESLNHIGGTLLLNDNYVLNSIAGLSGLNEIGGGVQVFNSDLSSFSGLEGLTNIPGDFLLHSSSLNDFTGLDNLSSIGGSLEVIDNAELSSMAGFESLTYIGGSVTFYENYYLTDLTAFSSLNSIGGGLYFYIGFYFNLTNLSGFENLTSIGGDLLFGNTNLGNYTNYSLSNLNGLQSLTSIGGNFTLSNCAALTNLTGLDNVNYIGGNIDINSNEALSSIAALGNINAINGDLTIYNNALINLTGFNNITSITGSFTVSGSNLTTLAGLNNLASIGGDFNVNWTTLNNLSGIENLMSIGGSLNINSNDYLISLAGLEGIGSIGENLGISGNGTLTDLTGLEGLSTVGGYLYIENASALTSLNGLENLISIGGELRISNNSLLTTINGLNGLTSLGGNFYVYSNPSLTTLEGIQNIDANSITGLTIRENSFLSSCEAQSICDYLATPGAEVWIENNATGCDSQTEVEDACGFCLPGGITFSTQADIDNFQTNHPGCNEIMGDVTIHGADITNLSGLSTLTSIRGNLDIQNNPVLTSLNGLNNLISIDGGLWLLSNNSLINLTGFESLTSIGLYCHVYFNSSLVNFTGIGNLTSIGGMFSIVSNTNLTSLTGLEGLALIGEGCDISYNNTLNNLSGLNNLSSIGDFLSLEANGLIDLSSLESLTSIGGYLLLSNNYNLTSLNGLEALTSLGGFLSLSSNDNMTDLSGLSALASIGNELDIFSNAALTSLKGLNNIASQSITSVYISDNPSLSTCEVQSICDYLVYPNGTVEIHDNAPGCNSTDEILDACDNKLTINQVGDTWYDLQSNKSMAQRIYAFPDGTIGATWTRGMDPNTSYSDRGTGYNYFDGTSWGPYPTSRIEQVKTGWPSYAPYGTNGEIVVSHTASSGLLFSWRENKGTGNWNYFQLAGPASQPDLFWPRMITSGENHNVIHVIACAGNGATYEGLNMALLYSRSSDGGQTWNPKNVILEGMGSDYTSGWRGDTYAWAEPMGNTIALLAFDGVRDGIIMKSTDGGDSWERITFYESPDPFSDMSGSNLPKFGGGDGYNAVVLDENDLSHVVFGRQVHEYGNYYVFSDGLVYWNENMAALDTAKIGAAVIPDDWASTYLFQNGNLLAWTQSPITNWVSNITYGSSLTSMPQLINNNGTIQLLYSAVTPGFTDQNNIDYRHLWGRTIDGNGIYGDFTDYTPSLNYHECAYPSVSPNTVNDLYHILYQSDDWAGNAVQSGTHSPVLNRMLYLSIRIDSLLTPEHFIPTWTGNSYSTMRIIVDGASYSNSELEPGDEIGIFDLDTDGNEICVGSGIVNSTISADNPLVILVSAEKPYTDIADGFTENNLIQFKFYNKNTNIEYLTVDAIFDPYFDDTFTESGTAKVVLSESVAPTQSISLTSGWNIASFNVVPDQLRMDSIYKPLMNSNTLVKVINESGQFIQYIPGLGWMNTIGNMAASEGYYTKVNANAQLDVTGLAVTTPFEVPLTTGWNIMGYPLNQSQNALTALQNLTNNNQLVKVINESGQFIQYIPGLGWMNTIGNFLPGEGYYIKVNANTSVTLDEPPLGNISQNTTFPEVAIFRLPFENNPYYPMNILVTDISINGNLANEGDEVAVMDGDLCVGAGVVTNYQGQQLVHIIASMDDPLTEITDGYSAGNQLSLKFLSKSLKQPIDLHTVSVIGTDVFEPLETYVCTLTDNALAINENYQSKLYLNCYPNPTTGILTIDYILPDDGEVKIEIADIYGKKLTVFEEMILEKGTHQSRFNMTSLNNGIYILRLNFSKNSEKSLKIKKVVKQ